MGLGEAFEFEKTGRIEREPGGMPFSSNEVYRMRRLINIDTGGNPPQVTVTCETTSPVERFLNLDADAIRDLRELLVLLLNDRADHWRRATAETCVEILYPETLKQVDTPQKAGVGQEKIGADSRKADPTERKHLRRCPK